MICSTPEVKQLNKERIRREIQKRERCTKTAIARETGLSIATCSTILNEMLGSGEILRVDQDTSHIGRPASQFRYNPDYQHVLAMYIRAEQGECAVEFAVADALGRQIRRETLHPAAVTRDWMEKLTGDIMRQDGLIQGMTLGLPGRLDCENIALCDTNLPIFTDEFNGEHDILGVELNVGNAMGFIASGVYSKISRGGKSGVCGGDTVAAVSFSAMEEARIGCGIVIDGKVLYGHSGFAGELLCVADGFGISRARQTEMMLDSGNRCAFRELAAKMVLTLIGTVNPGQVMLMGNGMQEADAAAVREACCRVVSPEHVPELLVDNDIAAYYITGLIRTALDRLQFPLSS